MKANDYDVPPMSPEEQVFIMRNCHNPDLIDLYTTIREKILLYGKIEIWITRGYLNFKHPYMSWNNITRTKEYKMGTLINVFFKEHSITLAFNTLGNTIHDPTNLLQPTKSYGVCNYYAHFKTMEDLEGLDEVIKQCIRLVSKEPRIVRINNKFISI